MGHAIKRLTSDDWERAALKAIAAGGLEAVAVEPLARRLGVTKGSFYSHFRDRDELVSAALRRWEQAQLDGFRIAPRGDGDRVKGLRDLLTKAIKDARSRTVLARLLLESNDRRVRAALRRVTEMRIARIQTTLTELGETEASAAHRATIAYAIYVGLLQLAREMPERLGDEQAIIRELTRMLVPELPLSSDPDGGAISSHDAPLRSDWREPVKEERCRV